MPSLGIAEGIIRIIVNQGEQYVQHLLGYRRTTFLLYRIQLSSKTSLDSLFALVIIKPQSSRNMGEADIKISAVCF